MAQPAARILTILRADIHPPLYFLLAHAWLELPLPGDTLVRFRLLSVVWTLAATVALDRLWLAGLRPARRLTVLALWCLSPAALLYGRMCRSYSMQVALAVVAVALAWRFLRQPRPSSLLASAAAMLALLYTHYVPGIALAAAFGAGLAWRAVRGRSLRRARLLALWSAILVAGYFPWLLQMSEALRRWTAASGFSSHYELTGSLWSEQILKLGYGTVSLVIGESFPLWALAVVPVVLLLLGFSFRRLWRVSHGLAGLLVLAAALGYLAVSHWVSYPFIPARLLWLLPFLLLWIALSPGVPSGARRTVVGLLLIVDAVGLVSYFGREHYRNKGYMVPMPEIAARIRASGDPAHSLLLLDEYNTDAAVLLYYLDGNVPHVMLTEPNRAAALSALRRPNLRQVWILRNTHDISPGLLASHIEAAACGAAPARRYFYVPYEPWEREAMRLAGIADPPAHFYQLTECAPASVRR